MHQPHALGGARLLRNVLNWRTNQGALIAYHHDLVAFEHLQGTDQSTVSLIDAHTDHALAPATLHRVLRQGRALAEAKLTDGEDRALLLRNDERDHLAIAHAHSAHTRSSSSHGAHIGFLEAHNLAGIGE